MQQAVMMYMQEDLCHAARLDVPVLISGSAADDSGSLAQLIHRTSRRAAGRFIDFSCAGKPAAQLEAALFGSVRAACAVLAHAPGGLLEQAHGGTLFLADVDAISLDLQVRLLEFLDSGKIRRVGADRAHTIASVRMITSTRRELIGDVRRNRFREDLYYRLNVIHLVGDAG